MGSYLIELGRKLLRLFRQRGSLPQARIVAVFCGFVIWIVFGGLTAATVAYELRLLETSTIGDPYPMTIYQQLPTPGTERPGSRGTAGADFTQVYTSALALRHGDSAYRPKNPQFRDRFGRPPGYPPLMNWIAVPLTFLDFTDAFLLYTAIAAFALFAVTAVLIWRAGLAGHVGRVALAQASLYFLTPIGLTYLERGQFDALVATAAALCVACVFQPRRSWLLASAAGLLGALKWTSVIFLGCFSLVGFILIPGRKRWSFALVPAVMLLGTLPFWPGLVEYWKTIRVYEIDAIPYGLTLQHFFPRTVARLIPVVATLMIAGAARYRYRSEADRSLILRSISAPFAIALMNLSVCFGTLSYEYHTVATLGMIPGLVLWTMKAEEVPDWVKRTVCLAFASSLVITFRTFGLGGTLRPETLTAIYVAGAIIFFGVCAFILVTHPRTELAHELSLG